MEQIKAAGAHHQAKRTYEDFEPLCKWHNRDNVVEVHLQGFGKEHLSVRTTHTGMLTIHGERPLDQTKSKWSRFHKEIKLPNNCDANRVAAKFADGILTVTMPPKVAPPPQPQSPHDDQKQQLPSHVDNQTNNDESVAKLIKQNQDGKPTSDEKAALLNEEVKPGSQCKFGQRNLASRKQIAVKLVLVVAVVVAFGFGAFIRYKHGHHSYGLEQID
ncbi:inactive protein RESTRICTED TEV MOVEMENT 2-like [Argentina anserina]|uniref:inactive protein RESTRICTED TEV MOVEMENT 2-like n=1 Tax=Argentina anserina TaxID=57926 RepID=UPI0021762644|nr:inactive protein RESTRICTED TEV MOVEMENT 2-like [Potentilla anserina]